MLPSGKRLHNYGKSQFFMGKSSTISMAMFNSYVCLPDGTEHPYFLLFKQKFLGQVLPSWILWLMSGILLWLCPLVTLANSNRVQENPPLIHAKKLMSAS